MQMIPTNESEAISSGHDAGRTEGLTVVLMRLQSVQSNVLPNEDSDTCETISVSFFQRVRTVEEDVPIRDM